MSLRDELIASRESVIAARAASLRAAHEAAEVEETCKEHRLYSYARNIFPEEAREVAADGGSCVNLCEAKNSSPGETRALLKLKKHYENEGYATWTKLNPNGGTYFYVSWGSPNE